MLIKELKVVDIKGTLKEINGPDRILIRAKKATWLFDGISREFSVSKDDQLFVPFLPPTMQELVCLCKGFAEYTPPCNVIVLNGAGSVRFKLCPPKPVSEAFMKYEAKVGQKEAISELRFIQPEIVEQGGNKLFTFWIGFAYDWYEVREFNLKTGEFGKCLRTARM